jgi:hypothetical protein
LTIAISSRLFSLQSYLDAIESTQTVSPVGPDDDMIRAAWIRVTVVGSPSVDGQIGATFPSVNAIESSKGRPGRGRAGEGDKNLTVARREAQAQPVSGLARARTGDILGPIRDPVMVAIGRCAGDAG